MDDNPEMLAIVRALANHLRQYPQHSDTAEGIATWWFPDQAAVDGPTLVDALDWMRRRGLVEVRSAKSTADRYGCNATPAQLDHLLQELSRQRLT